MANKIKLIQILDNADATNFRQVDYAKLFIWFLTDVQGKEDCLMPDIVRCFRDASLSIPNQTTLRRNLRRLKDITVGHSYKSFRLHRNTLIKYRSEYANMLSPSPSPEEIIRQRLDVSNAPSLTPTDIENAYKMGQVCVAMHCLENSVRNLIRTVLKNHLGEHWWDTAASSEIKQKVDSRKKSEAKKKWLASRGADELHYADWGDLVKLMRKYPDKFDDYTGDINFVVLRLGELENLRNTIAHNGILSDDDIERIELYFKDWCKQVS
ncbi:Swt1 family HEPN domain-containing protein [Chloroflexota bacterium]